MYMTLFDPAERHFARAAARAGYANPFLPDRINAEREALGGEFIEADSDWNVHAGSGRDHPSIDRMAERSSALAETIRERLVGGTSASEADIVLYEDLALFALYHQHYKRLFSFVEEPVGQARRVRVGFYRAFAADAAHLLKIPGVRLPGDETPAHLFACFFQIVRAFLHIYQSIIGTSAPASRLRAAAWESIFTHDLRRYRRGLFARMRDITTLITGPSGTGKELVASAIALSQYVPFDARTQTFDEDFAESFHALSIPALSTNLIESELFGHRRGAFTGALEDHRGWLETCGPHDTVFLDEVGDIEPLVQVKLLRVLQMRTFSRLGESTPRKFAGKLIAATNRDLAKEMRAGRFREDLYYRLCSDMIVTPSLHELLAGSHDQLRELVGFVAHRVAGEQADTLVDQVLESIDRNLGEGYRWPGNFRELEQCVRNILVRGQYLPAPSHQRAGDDLAAALESCGLTADQLLRKYCTLVHARTGSYEETARRLALDRRTVKSKVR